MKPGAMKLSDCLRQAREWSLHVSEDKKTFTLAAVDRELPARTYEFWGHSAVEQPSKTGQPED